MDRKEKNREAHRRYKEKYPDRVRASVRKWREKMKANRVTRQPNTCQNCGKTMTLNRGEFKNHVRFCTSGEASFWKRVTKSEGCWLYRGHTLNTGHADLTRMRVKILAHRYSWMIHNGPIPDGLQVLHKCDTPLCVRPDHLFLGTQAENNYDRHAKGRSARGEMGRHKITEAQAVYIKSQRGKRRAKDLAVEFGISRMHVSQIWCGRMWKHLPSPSL